MWQPGTCVGAVSCLHHTHRQETGGQQPDSCRERGGAREASLGDPHSPRQSAQLSAVASCSWSCAGAGHQQPHYLNDVEWPPWPGRVPGGGQEGIPSSAPPAAAWPRTKAGCCSLAAPHQSLGPRSARLRSCRTLAAARGHCGALLALLLLSVLCILRGLCWLLAATGQRRRSAGCLLSALQLHPPLSLRNTTLCLSSDAMYRVRISRYLLL